MKVRMVLLSGVLLTGLVRVAVAQQGGQVVQGGATITNPNPTITQINQLTNSAMINWNNFSTITLSGSILKGVEATANSIGGTVSLTAKGASATIPDSRAIPSRQGTDGDPELTGPPGDLGPPGEKGVPPFVESLGPWMAAFLRDLPRLGW